MPAIRRTLKNAIKNYSDAQVKVREATSNDPWGPSSTLMSEIADLTYNVVAFTEIMQMIWKRLNDDGKNWRHVYKSLVVLDYIIKTGSEKVAQQCKENFHAIKTLTTFQYIDIDNKDQGMNVREKAKQLVSMLSDDERLKNERAKALKAKERFAQNAMGVGNGHATSRSRVQMGSPTLSGGYQDTYHDSSPGSGSAGTPSEIECARPSSAGEEELQLQLALAMSKEEHDEAVRKQKSDDIKLQMAIEQSREQARNESSQSPTLLDLAASSTSAGQAATNDIWGMPRKPSLSTDPWGGPLPRTAHAVPPDPWASSGAAGIQSPVYSPVHSSSASASARAPLPQSNDPWGLPVSAQSSQPGASAWASASPTTQVSAWGGSSATSQQQSAGGFDPFGAPRGPISNGASTNNIDSEFDLLSSRSTDSSPVKSAHGFEEFDLLSGGAQTNGSTSDVFNLDPLNKNMPENKKKSAETFLGGHANLVNLEQLVAKAPPKGNNPFAMTSGQNNPFQTSGAGVRMPMSQMSTGNLQGFTQPVNAGLLPAPLLPIGSVQLMQPNTQQQQQSYNPFL